jgi:hypothetical protein
MKIVCFRTYSRTLNTIAKLTWNASEYSEIEKIDVPPQDVWKPTIALSSSAAEDILSEKWYSLLNVVIYFDGLMKWTVGGMFKSNCFNNDYEVDTKMNCTFSFRSWLHTTEQVTLRLAENANVSSSVFTSYTRKPTFSTKDESAFQDQFLSIPDNDIYSRVNFTLHIIKFNADITLIFFSLQFVLI